MNIDLVRVQVISSKSYEHPRLQNRGGEPYCKYQCAPGGKWILTINTPPAYGLSGGLQTGSNGHLRNVVRKDTAKAA